MSGVQQLTVEPGDGEQRLDRWLKRRFPNLTQGMIEKMCRKGDIRVDKGRVKPAARIIPGQTVRIPPLPDPATKPPVHKVKATIADRDAQMIRDAVLYRDDDIIALNKPAGLPTQGGTGQNRHVDGLGQALRFGLDENPRLVHRLDKDTSGVLLMARSRSAAQALSASIRHRQTRKIYWALVAGVPTPYLGEIKFALLKAGAAGAGNAGYEKMRAIHPRDIGEAPGAKRAHTLYATLYRVASRAAWVAMEPITGRTHQLRAHMGKIGHPIAGDGKYGGSRQENPGDGWGARIGGVISDKLHLHARRMVFEHPINRTQMVIEAPLPDHMAATWQTFGWSADMAAPDPFAELF